MTRRERVFAAIRHEKTDIVPYNIGLTGNEAKVLAAYFRDGNLDKRLGNHIRVEWYGGNLVEIREGSRVFRDEFGIVWDKSGLEADIGVVDGTRLEEPSMEGFPYAKVYEEQWRKQLQALADSTEDVIKFPAIGFSLFDRAWTFRGVENFLVDMISEPEFTEELLDFILQYHLRVIDIALEYDIDGIHFADDWGQQRGLVMGPALWRKYIRPRTAAMYERVKRKGKIVSQHSCGDNHEIFPDLVEIGLDIYQTLQPEIYDLAKIKREFGRDLSFWGGISTQRLLPFGTPEEVKAQVRETLSLMSEGGGYIAGPAHDIVEGTPPENVEALLEVLSRQQ
jgi:uroporphyrinogen decarboxylase